MKTVKCEIASREWNNRECSNGTSNRNDSSTFLNASRCHRSIASNGSSPRVHRNESNTDAATAMATVAREVTKDEITIAVVAVIVEGIVCSWRES
jgi:hypothetical protein